MRYWVLTAVGMIVVGLPLVIQAGGRVMIDNEWARATIGQSLNGVVFMTLTDTSGQGDTLVAAASPVAAVTELHVHRLVNGIMQMYAVKSVQIPAGRSIILQPGAEHIMLMGLKQPLREGETVPISLTFAHAGIVETMAQVRGIGAMGLTDKDVLTEHSNSPHAIGHNKDHNGSK